MNGTRASRWPQALSQGSDEMEGQDQEHLLHASSMSGAPRGPECCGLRPAPPPGAAQSFSSSSRPWFSWAPPRTGAGLPLCVPLR